MRKVLLIVLAFILLFALSVPVLSSAEGLTPYGYASAFATAYPERSVLSGNEKAASTYLASFLTNLGYRVETPSFTYRYTAVDTSAAVTSEYRHVLGFKDNGRGKSIVIGTYYGGYDPDTGTTAGQGAEAALSVGALMYVAEALASYTEYDLVIAFWGGLSVSDFDATKCGVDLKDIALYIGLDGVAAGTNDYEYCDDVPRSHETYFREVIEEANAPILPPPTYKRSTLLLVSSGSYQNTHLGLLGVNRDFLNEDVPCIAFVGGAWSYDVGLYRYEGKAEIAGTNEDTFETIDKRNGGRENTETRLLTVSNVIVTALRGEGLSAALDATRKEVSGADLDSSLAYYLITFIGAGVIIALFVLLIVKSSKTRREEVWEGEGRESDTQDTETPPVYKSPFSEFDPDDDPPQGGEDNGDDVFRF